MTRRYTDGWRHTGDVSFMDHGACRDADAHLFFVEKHAYGYVQQVAAAKAICAECPVREECLDYALTNNENFGIWGGATVIERRKIKRRRRAEGTMAPPQLGGKLTPIRHGEPGQYQKCQRRNGRACQACKAQRRIDQATERAARAVREAERRRSVHASREELEAAVSARYAARGRAKAAS